MNTITKSISACLALVAMASCGGGSDLAGGGIGGTGISQGPITGFGSVYVNGIKFEDTGAAIEIEDTPSLRTGLKVGMVVKIAWDRDAAGVYTARSIVYGDDVQGPVANKGVAGAGISFTVLGQTVVTHPATTVFDTVPAETLADGNVVEISGLKDAAGVIHATRVEFKKTAAAQGEIFEMKGVVASLNTNTKTFMLGTATVNYSAVSAAVPESGRCVEVKSTDGLNIDGQLIAREIESEDSCTPGGGTEGQELKVKGFPSAIDIDTNTLTVNGQAISYTDAAFNTLVTGKRETDLSTSVIVEVEGALSSDGVLVAKSISFEFEMEGTALEAMGTAAGRIDNNTLRLDGMLAAFTVNDRTLYEDATGENPNFGKASIEPGYILKVYYTNTTGANVAIRIKREG